MDDTHRTNQRTIDRRQLPLILVASLLAILATGASVVSSAEAAVPASFTGWATVDQSFRCMAALPHCTDPHYPAWRWTGTTWQSTTVRHGTSAYVYPYAGSWHWIWTQRTGWLAIDDAYVMQSQIRCAAAFC